MDGLEQVWQLPPRDGPRDVGMAAILVEKRPRKHLVALAVRFDKESTFFVADLHPEHGREGWMESNEGEVHALNGLCLNERRRLELLAQTGPDTCRGVSIRAAQTGDGD